MLDAVSQTGEADEAWRLAELFAQFRAEQQEESQFEALARFAGQSAEIGFPDGPRGFEFRRGFDAQAEPAQHTCQRIGEFADRDGGPTHFDFEIVKDGARGIADEFGVEQAGLLADQLDGHQFGGAGDRFAASHFKQQTIRVHSDHGCSSSLRTAWTKSVASWNRRYTLANRT